MRNMANAFKNINKEKYSTSELSKIDFEISEKTAFLNLKSPETDDFTKVFSIVQIESLNSFDETFLLFSHLIGHANPIREACAFKIEELSYLKPEFYKDERLETYFLNSIVDINPNVSRAICAVFSNFSELAGIYEEKIIEKTLKLLAEIKKLEDEGYDSFLINSKNRKSHAKNKKTFALYWLLEAISIVLSNKSNDNLLEILNFTIQFQDYTIREKTAKILAKMDFVSKEILTKAKADVNFYVKNQLYDKINFETDY